MRCEAMELRLLVLSDDRGTLAQRGVDLGSVARLAFYLLSIAARRRQHGERGSG